MCVGVCCSLFLVVGCRSLFDAFRVLSFKYRCCYFYGYISCLRYVLWFVCCVLLVVSCCCVVVGVCLLFCVLVVGCLLRCVGSSLFDYCCLLLLVVDC